MEVRVLSRKKAEVDWPAEVARWRTAGMSRAAFCSARELSYQSFIYWEKKLASAKAPQLMQIHSFPQGGAGKPKAPAREGRSHGRKRSQSVETGGCFPFRAAKPGTEKIPRRMDLEMETTAMKGNPRPPRQ